MHVAKFDPVKLAEAMGSTVEGVHLHFYDGRKAQGLMFNYFDNIDPWGLGWSAHRPSSKLVHFDGEQTMVKAVTKDAVMKPPSGYGGSRNCTNAEALDWIKKQHSFVFCDVWKFPSIPCWLISKRTILGWFRRGVLFVAHSPQTASILAPVFDIKRKKMMDLMWNADPPLWREDRTYYAASWPRPYVDFRPVEQEELARV